MCTPTSCSSAPYSSHSRSRSPSPCTLRVWSKIAQREPRDLLRVLRPVAAALAELDDAAAPDVGVALDLADARAVAVDVVEDEPFAQREVAEREVVGAEPARGSCRAAPSRRRASRRGADRGRACAAASSRSASTSRLRSRWSALALTRRLRSVLRRTPPSSLERERAEAEDRARRADHAVEAACRRSGRGRRPSRLLRCLTSRRSSRAGERVALDEALGQPDHAELEAARRA